MNRPLRVAMFVGTFPELSETFIVRQIAGLLELGHTIHIFANGRPWAGSPVHPEARELRLVERTTYMDGPEESLSYDLPVWPITGRTWAPGSETPVSNWRRLAQALPALGRSLLSSPRLTVRVLDNGEYGYQAASLSALYRLASLRGTGRGYDVLHAHFGPVGNSFRFARELWSAPLVVTFHGYDFCVVPREEGSGVYRPLFAVVDLVTVNSDYTRRRVIELGCPAHRIRKLHVGLNLEQFSYRVRRVRGDVRLLSVCRLVEKKGIEYALRAVAAVRPDHPGLKYDIIGDGPLLHPLERLRDELGLQGNVFMHGAKDSRFVAQQMGHANIFLLPSVTAADGDQEGTPVSLMEAQASGIPVLSTQHSGIPEVVLSGQSGFLVRERDVPALTEKLRFLIEHPDICEAMGARGRQHMEANFDLVKLNQNLESIYREAIECFRAEPHHARRTSLEPAYLERGAAKRR